MGSLTEAKAQGKKHWSQQYNTGQNIIELKENWVATEDDKLEAPPQWGWMEGKLERPYRADPPTHRHEAYEMYIAAALGAFILAVIGRLCLVAETNFADHANQVELVFYASVAFLTALQ